MAKKKIVRKQRVANRKSKTGPKRQSDASRDKSLRQHLLYLLGGGGAHISFDNALQDWPVQLASAKVSNFPHTAWMLVEHMRIAQWDILEFSRNASMFLRHGPKGIGLTRKGRRMKRSGRIRSRNSKEIFAQWRNWLPIRRRTFTRNYPGETARPFCARRCLSPTTMHIISANW